MNRAGELRRFLNLAVTNAGSARTDALVRPGDHRTHGLKVDIPAPIRHVVGVADFMSKLRTLAAHIANSCHCLKSS